MISLSTLTNSDIEHFNSCMEYTLRTFALYAPFFLYSLYKIDIKPVHSTKPAFGYTNGVIIRMCYPLCRNVTQEEFAGIVYHELLHILNLHIDRLGSRDISKWNIACDININATVSNAKGFSIPKNTIRNRSLEHLACEDIYDKLPDNQEDSSGTSCDLDYTHDENRKEQVETLIKESCSVYGEVGNGIDRQTVDAIFNKKVDWKKALRKYITKYYSDFSFIQRDHRFEDIYVPSVSDSIPKSTLVGVGIDLSMSITSRDLSIMLGHCLSIERAYPTTKFIFIPFDEETYGVFNTEGVMGIQKSFTSFKGGGGTSFVAVLKELNKLKPIVIIMFTDLCGFFPEDKPLADVLWVDITGSTDIVPPFGKVYGK